MKKLLIVAGLLLAATGVSYGQTPTKFVSASGSAVSACTVGTPCTVARANAIAIAGDIIQVNNCPGTTPCYTGTFNLSTSGTSSQRIVWQSQTPQGAKFNGVLNVYGSFITVRLMDIEDTGTADDGITTIFNSSPPVYGQFVELRNNYIHDIQFATSQGCGGNSGILIAAGSHDFVVDSNTILRAGHWGGCVATSGTSAHGLYISGYHGTVTNNQISNVAGYGIELYHNPCQNVIANNTVFHNFTGGIQLAGPADGLAPCSASSNDFDSVNNNLIVHNGFCPLGSCAQTGHPHQPILISSGTGSHNKVFNNLMAGNLNENGAAANAVSVNGGTAPVSGGNLGQTATTGIFVNYQDDGSGDYNLVSSSPARNAGTGGTTNCAVSPGITPCIPQSDIVGAARPTSSTQDIGAYLFASAGNSGVSLSPSPLAFGNVAVSSSSTLVATLRNSGTVNLTFSAATISGTNASSFSVANGSTPCVSPLGAGSTCNYNITATPQAAGSLTATLNLNNNSPVTPAQLPLTVTGGSPAATFNPTSLSFGVVAPSSCSTAQTFTLTSSGNTGLTINSGPTITGTNANQFTFGGIGNCPTTGLVASGTSCTYSAKFCPTTSGAKVAQENVFTTAPTSPDAVPLSGTGGAPVVSLTPSSANCGSRQVGTSGTCQVFTLTNTGNIDLTNIVITIP